MSLSEKSGLTLKSWGFVYSLRKKRLMETVYLSHFFPSGLLEYFSIAGFLGNIAHLFLIDISFFHLKKTLTIMSNLKEKFGKFELSKKQAKLVKSGIL